MISVSHIYTTESLLLVHLLKIEIITLSPAVPKPTKRVSGMENLS